MAQQMTVQVIAGKEEIKGLYDQINNNSKVIVCTVEIGGNQYKIEVLEGTELYEEVVRQIVELERERMKQELQEFDKKHPPKVQ